MHRFQHQELATGDVEGAKRFYSAVFDWSFQGFPMGGSMYWMVNDPAGQGLGGIAEKQMPEQPTAWTGFITVASVLKTLDKVRAAGGKVVVDFVPIPGMGGYAVAADPQGAVFGVWENAAPPPAAKKAAAKKKPAAKKALAKKKAAPKKAAPKKAAPKKAAPKRAAPKRAGKKKGKR